MSKDNATRKRRGRPPTTAGTLPTFTVRLPDDLVQAMVRFAASKGLTRSEVIRVAVADYLKRKRAI